MIKMRNEQIISVGKTKLKVLVSMEALTNGTGVFCPHCGENVWESVPDNPYEERACPSCGGLFYTGVFRN